MSALTGEQSEGSGSTPAAPAAAIAEGSEDAQETERRLGCFHGRAAMRQERPSKKAKKVQYPDDVPEAVKSAIDNFKAPTGFDLCPCPSSLQRSIVFIWGVRMVRKSVVADRGGHVKQEWVCMASHACRQARKRLVITSAQTSNATQHLSQVHKLKSAKAKTMKIT